jgi:hypothetical protein
VKAQEHLTTAATMYREMDMGFWLEKAEVALKEVGSMTFRLSDEERRIVLQTLKARLDALHGEMTRTDSPAFNIRLKREEKIIQALIERLGSALSRRPVKVVRSGRRSRTGKRQR